MNYRDIVNIEKKTGIGVSPILHEICIAWTAGHESAEFYVDEPVHADAVVVWFFPKYFYNWKYNALTHKYRLMHSGWEFLEIADGMPKMTVDRNNRNPFCPFDLKYTGGHFATCKFPSNFEKHPGKQCRRTVIVEEKRLEMNQ